MQCQVFDTIILPPFSQLGKVWRFCWTLSDIAAGRRLNRRVLEVDFQSRFVGLEAIHQETYHLRFWPDQGFKAIENCCILSLKISCHQVAFLLRPSLKLDYLVIWGAFLLIFWVWTTSPELQYMSHHQRLMSQTASARDQSSTDYAPTHSENKESFVFIAFVPYGCKCREFVSV